MGDLTSVDKIIKQLGGQIDTYTKPGRRESDNNWKGTGCQIGLAFQRSAQKAP